MITAQKSSLNLQQQILERTIDIEQARLTKLLHKSHSGNGLLESQVKLMYPEQLRRWKEAPATAQLPEGENLQQVWERAIPVWQKIVASTFEASAIPKTVLVVAHSTVNKVILCHVSGKGLQHFWNFKQDNCAINIIDYPEGYDAPAEVQAMNISTHITGIKQQQ